MMDFKEFQDKIKEDMEARTWGISFNITQVEKLQGQSYTGLSIQPNDGIVAANVNLDQMYGAMLGGQSYEQVLDSLVEHSADIIADMPKFDLDDLTNYDHMKQKLVVQVIPTERNQEMLSGIPHKNIEDMSMVYRMMMEKDSQGISSILVTNSMLENYGVTPEQLHQDAMDAAVINQPATFRSMEDVMRQLVGEEMYEMMGPMNTVGPQMYVASVEGGVNGAGVIGYPDFMDQVAEQIGGDFFVLPSSVHEVLVLPDDGSMNRQDLEMMVRDVNAAEVQPEDQLSDNVYHYDSQDKVFELAASYENRMAVKEAAMEYGAATNDVHEMGSDVMTVLMVEPNRNPEVMVIGTDLESLQKAVGGNIKVTYPYEENVALIMNEEGKINGLPLNRALRDEDGQINDIVAGTFLVAGLTEDNFGSLTKDQINTFEEKFHQPEAFIRMGKGIMAVPIPDEVVKEMDKERARPPKEKTKASRNQDVLS